MRTLRTTMIAMLAIGLLSIAPLGAAPVDAPLERWVVGFDRGAGLPEDLGAVLADLGAVDGVALTTIDAVAVTLPAGAISRLTARGDVVGARPEGRLNLHLSASVPFIGADRATLGVPETIAVDAGEEAFEVERPAVDGSDQVVAVVDTGVFSQHLDLAGQVIGSFDFELAYAGELLLTTEQLDDFAEITGPLAGTTDDVGHGTHVAGIVAGTGEATANRANGNRGVAPGAKVVDLRISPQAHSTDNNVGWERNALAAYDWLVRHHDDAAFGPHGIRVANNSWGVGPSTIPGEELDYEPFAELLPAAAEAGIAVVFSAGNSGPGDDVTEELLPTGHPDVITVAAGCKPGTSSRGCIPSDPDARIADFSSHGPAVDVTAPGVDILSSVNPSSGMVLGQLGGDFSGDGREDEVRHRATQANFSGTSMSGPHVAGLVALLFEANPDLAPAEVRFILGATARDLLEPGRDIGAGWGMVDAPDALRAAVRLAAGVPLADQFPDFDPSPSL